MFEFRIINLTDGNQVIRRDLKTPYSALTSAQMIEYTEVDIQLAVMDRIRRKEKKEQEHRRKLLKNPLYRIACLCGIV